MEVRFVRIDCDLCVDRAYRSGVTLLHLIKQSVLTVLLLLFNDNYLLYIYAISVFEESCFLVRKYTIYFVYFSLMLILWRTYYYYY